MFHFFQPKKAEDSGAALLLLGFGFLHRNATAYQIAVRTSTIFFNENNHSALVAFVFRSFLLGHPNTSSTFVIENMT